MKAFFTLTFLVSAAAFGGEWDNLPNLRPDFKNQTRETFIAKQNNGMRERLRIWFANLQSEVANRAVDFRVEKKTNDYFSISPVARKNFEISFYDYLDLLDTKSVAETIIGLEKLLVVNRLRWEDLKSFESLLNDLVDDTVKLEISYWSEHPLRISCPIPVEERTVDTLPSAGLTNRIAIVAFLSRLGVFGSTQSRVEDMSHAPFLYTALHLSI